FGWSFWIEEQTTPAPDGMPTVARADAAELESHSLVARTDRGTTLPLYRPNRLGDGTRALERERSLAQGPYSLRLIATGERTAECNCHGWIFARGRFWLMGKDVEQILVDNGYNTVTEPGPG